MSDEFEQYKKTYSKVNAAIEVQEQNYLVDVFSGYWKAKYSSFPIFPTSHGHFQQMRDFRKAAGPKAAELIEHYFEMKDEWFMKQSYSLDCLCKNINKVNASFSSRAARNSGGKITGFYACDACAKQFQYEMSQHYNFGFLRCNECTRENKPFKYVTKEERVKATIGMGQAILDLEKI